jgi:hypothetical protein
MHRLRWNVLLILIATHSRIAQDSGLTTPAFFGLLREETHLAARVVLGHFVFVHNHPSMDGNERMGRSLMNVMMASGGYPWTVIPVGDRKIYMADMGPTVSA